MSSVHAVAQRLIGKSKKMKKKVFEVDQEMIDRKSMEVGRVFEGLTIPEVFAVTGSVVVELVSMSGRQGYDIRGIVTEWLTQLSSFVEEVKIEPEVDENERFYAN